MPENRSLWIDSLLHPIYSSEVPIIKATQELFSESEDFLVQASLLGDPSKAFYIFFPLCFALDQAVGVRYLASVILSEWSNQILKWLLHGHRPYWWIPLNLPHLASNYAQTSITCETGPGNPSGHVMMSVVTCGALYRLMQTFFCSSPKTSNNPLALAVTRMAGNLLIVWVAVIGASRIYILAHFPHQCFLALLIGFFCYQLAFSNTVKWTKWSAKVLMISAVILATSAFGVFMTAEHFLQFDINWSLQLASKFCEKAEWIYVDTTPLYALVRYSGSALGFALGFSRKIRKSSSKEKSMVSRSASLIGSLAIGYGFHLLHKIVPQNSMLAFYAAQYMINSLSTFSIIKLVSWL